MTPATRHLEDDAWTLAFGGFEPDQEGLREALCTLGNGYLGTRGAAPEATADGVHYPGTYLAGVYNRLTSSVAGREIESEDLVNAPNWLVLRVRIGRRWLDRCSFKLTEQQQELDLRRAVLTRRMRIRDHLARTTSITQRRFVSMAEPHLAAIETTLLAEDWSGRVTVRSALDGQVTNSGVARYRDLRGDHLVPLEWEAVDAETVLLTVETRNSKIRIAEAARTRVRTGGDGTAQSVPRRTHRQKAYIGQDVTLDLELGVPVTVEKVAAVYTSRDKAIYEPAHAALTELATAPDFDEALGRHVLAWDQLWSRFDTQIAGSTKAQQILRVHLFHLLQTASPHSIDLDVGIPARGLHGEAYRGHIFWDELFMLPLLNLHLPAVARSPLEYRYRRLRAARVSAAEAGFRGAMYPWQSGSDGRETSQTWHLNPRSGRWLPDYSHLQRHVGIAVAHNAWLHWEATGDLPYLRFRCAPMVIEIARFLTSAMDHDRARDRYELRGVMGPDEYHDAYPWRDEPGLDNNAYTNVMAVWVLLRALETLDALPAHQRDELSDELSLTRQEIEAWEEASRKMVVPFHGGRIISQFEGYADLEELDWDAYRRRYGDIHRLDRILEAEDDSTNRYQASKQADALMLFYLLPPAEVAALLARLGYDFDADIDTRANVEYYLRRTSDGSTLSRLVHSWVMARLDRRRSWELLLEALESDVADIQGGTTAEGIHLGAMAGTVDLVQVGYGGIELHGGRLRLDPRLPDEMSRLAFTLHHRGHRLTVDIDHSRVRVQAQPDAQAAVELAICGNQVLLAPGRSIEVRLARPASR